MACYSQATPSRSRSRCGPYPGSPLRSGAAPAARAWAQLLKLAPGPTAGREPGTPFGAKPNPGAESAELREFWDPPPDRWQW